MYLQKINLKNKYALVTGAGKGLGRACSIALAEAGATVIALSRTPSDLNNLEKDIKKVKGKIIKVSCDVMNYEDLKKKLDKIGISVFKVAMPWPLDTRDLTKWAKGFSKILVLEEKRNIIEDQLARALYHLDDDNRPKLIGKTFEEKNIFVPSYGELNSKIIKEIFNDIFSKSQKSEIPIFTNVLGNKKSLTKNEKESLDRNPWFCAGCPHNTSTKIPNGSKAFSGIGCHFMVNSMDRETATFTHMGGEGSSWIGISPFVEENHIFQNIGDGTYFHSGILSIRAAISSGVNITFKILFNEAVALTGGQAVDGKLTTIDLAWQLFSEGVSLIAIVSVTKDKYHPSIKLPENVKIFSRNELDEVQKKYRNEKGVTAIIYDQVCAAELRRKRKRNILPEPNKEIFINDKVCEGCGDCNAHSNCVAVQPYETKLGRKRIIDKNLCNKDMTCVDGYCPSFVLVEGVKKKSTFSMDTIRSKVLKLIPPLLPKLNKEYASKLKFNRIDLNKGDVLFFSNLCPHKSKKNLSNFER